MQKKSPRHAYTAFRISHNEREASFVWDVIDPFDMIEDTRVGISLLNLF